jgi:hypothetical protein
VQICSFREGQTKREAEKENKSKRKRKRKRKRKKTGYLLCKSQGALDIEAVGHLRRSTEEGIRRGRGAAESLALR